MIELKYFYRTDVSTSRHENIHLKNLNDIHKYRPQAGSGATLQSKLSDQHLNVLSLARECLAALSVTCYCVTCAEFNFSIPCNGIHKYRPRAGSGASLQSELSDQHLNVLSLARECLAALSVTCYCVTCAEFNFSIPCNGIHKYRPQTGSGATLQSELSDQHLNVLSLARECLAALSVTCYCVTCAEFNFSIPCNGIHKYRPQAGSGATLQSELSDQHLNVFSLARECLAALSVT
ncbi:hypothetical protein J6590_028964 [Homalodisca vitripennis]|nr:hypothetical protein J6590_028964 [Homalodisca vitripennis]